MKDSKFWVTRTVRGHAHTEIHGQYVGNVTREQIEENFKNPYFGGRWGFFGSGEFMYITHDD